MPTYAIGDLQGCLDELLLLLEHIGWDRGHDTLWFTGDLVNRGPQSLEALRFVRALGDSAVTVLGNHDLHLLAVALGGAKPHHGDTLDAVLRAADRDELLDWLRARPLLHEDPALGYTLLHAGVPPQWDPPTLRECAREVEAALRDDRHRAFLANLYGNQPDRWSPDLGGWERLRFITNAYTRMRYCTPEGQLDFHHKGPPGTQGPGLLPWYAVPGRASANLRILFGHWSTHGKRGADASPYNAWALDTGCLWGGPLTAMRLEDGRMFSVPSLRGKDPPQR